MDEAISEIKRLLEPILIMMRLQPPRQPPSNIPSSIDLIPEGTLKEANCSNGWYITGYFLPVESDYSNKKVKTIHVQGKTRTFSEKFLDDVNIEGWGLTLKGDYIGYDFKGRYKINNRPLGSENNELLIGDVATDYSYIPFGSTVQIPTLPEPWNKKLLKAHDVGPAINGKHIDIYTGEGKKAEQETFRITTHDNRVCWK